MRSEGGKGFKRKNEMIRHGLVHSSPGFVCPFCPEREHRYPRPDNLQRYGGSIAPRADGWLAALTDGRPHRHVRAHHTDKDRDDPVLREVLSQQRTESQGKTRRRRMAGMANPAP